MTTATQAIPDQGLGALPAWLVRSRARLIQPDDARVLVLKSIRKMAQAEAIGRARTAALRALVAGLPAGPSRRDAEAKLEQLRPLEEQLRNRLNGLMARLDAWIAEARSHGYIVDADLEGLGFLGMAEIAWKVLALLFAAILSTSFFTVARLTAESRARADSIRSAVEADIDAARADPSGPSASERVAEIVKSNPGTVATLAAPIGLLGVALIALIAWGALK